ncbi:MAG: chemotaxis protein CheW, partial [Actinomycetota bacterium]|jgi:two-component system chemotaxis sensor kinase CheA|nr:chemotaxis protein CheW [Actinomycetota bacterium]
VHLLRNGIDHGIEDAETRHSVGKPGGGTMVLSASREREHVIITLADDGKGIDPDVIWRKAVERGLVTADERADYSENDVLLFTCVPGFSTAAVATRVSGRGVGMDVVKGKIEHLGGTIAIDSELGSGTVFTLRLPLTLAIIQALMVRTGDGQIFAVPLSSVDEILEPAGQKVDTIDGAPVMVLRDGRVVPLHRLDALLGVSSDARRPPQLGEHIVLVDVVGVPKALVVSQIAGRQEIVIKPLSRMLREAKGLGGATVLGDGTVALILDPRTMFPTKEELQ